MQALVPDFTAALLLTQDLLLDKDCRFNDEFRVDASGYIFHKWRRY
jgi:hypothetical protein